MELFDTEVCKEFSSRLASPLELPRQHGPVSGSGAGAAFEGVIVRSPGSETLRLVHPLSFSFVPAFPIQIT